MKTVCGALTLRKCVMSVSQSITIITTMSGPLAHMYRKIHSSKTELVLFENDNLIVIYFLGIEIFFVMSNDNYYYMFSVSLFFSPLKTILFNMIIFQFMQENPRNLPTNCQMLDIKTV
jgi:hypothetical protein